MSLEDHLLPRKGGGRQVEPWGQDRGTAKLQMHIQPRHQLVHSPKTLSRGPSKGVPTLDIRNVLFPAVAPVVMVR